MRVDFFIEALVLLVFFDCLVCGYGTHIFVAVKLINDVVADYLLQNILNSYDTHKFFEVIYHDKHVAFGFEKGMQCLL